MFTEDEIKILKEEERERYRKQMNHRIDCICA
jgi:hypothetical protein